MAVIDVGLLEGIEVKEVCDVVYGGVLGGVEDVVRSVADDLLRPQKVTGEAAKAAEAEISAARAAHVSELMAWVDAGVGAGEALLEAVWEQFKGLCRGFVGMVNSVIESCASFGVMAAEVSTAVASVVLAPVGTPMLTQLKGSVATLYSLVGSVESCLGEITLVARQFGFISLEGVGQWLGLAVSALKTVRTAVGLIPLKK